MNVPKFKPFLCLVALGLTPSHVIKDASGSPIQKSDNDTQINLDWEWLLEERDKNPEAYKRSEEYSLVDDMVLSRDAKRQGVEGKIWPHGRVPYMIGNVDAERRKQVHDAIYALQAKSCVKFVPAGRDERAFLIFENNKEHYPKGGCISDVGYNGVKYQIVQLDHGCTLGNTIHELIHAIGFYHEHTRDDRDDYVRINLRNLEDNDPRTLSAFEKTKDRGEKTETYGVPYNYDSIMHYGRDYFARRGTESITPYHNPRAATPLGSWKNIGQRTFISEGDWTMINKRYNCRGYGHVEEEDDFRRGGQGRGHGRKQQRMQSRKKLETPIINGSRTHLFE